MYQQPRQREKNLPNQIQKQIRVYKHDQVIVFPLTQQIMKMTVGKVIADLIRPKMGYSSRIFLYKEPICSYNKIDFCNPSLTLFEIIKQLGDICFTFNNTQYAEEPDYNHAPVYSRPPAQDSIQALVQISQNNYFVHENYRVPLSTRISFFNSICSRYGRNIFVQYCNTRLNLTQFAPDSIIEHTLAKFIDSMKRLTITVDSVLNESYSDVYFQQVTENFLIDNKFYFKLWLVNSSLNKKIYPISRKCTIQSLKYLLGIIYKQDCKLYHGLTDQQLDDRTKTDDVDLVVGRIKKEEQKIIVMEESIQDCQIIGTIGGKGSKYVQVFIVSNSAILHRIMVDLTGIKYCVTAINHLSCPATSNLDQDLFFIKNNQLIGYAITINMIKVKQYSVNGDLLAIKIFPWYHQLYEIQFTTVDLFCVRLKTDRSKVRVFFIDDPENYIEIDLFAKFFPAKLGNNIYSDGSGHFAILNSWYEQVQMYSLLDKQRLSQIKLSDYTQSAQVLFGGQSRADSNDRKVFINVGNKIIHVYSMYKGILLTNILCQKGMNNFFCIGEELGCSIGSQIRIFRSKQGSWARKAYECWSQPIYIPQKCGVILRDSQKRDLFIRDKVLKFDYFSKFYLY